ncbi:lopap-like [Ostrinia nubilalis]|uniref:lopap-like n=1 Tax=Ostrinia furnacalis TaxID=93504 RepID=UPI00104098DE|nr:lopap-like [Ostrinia furnacalis]
MLLRGLVLGLLLCQVDAVLQNVTCPVVTPRELDWKALDGKWYIAAIASDLSIEADCAMLVYNHMNSTDVSVSWITNNTVTYYNGSVAITVDPDSNSTSIGDLLQVTYTDQKSESYSFLDVDYEHYAVLFACYDNEDGNSSTYEIWKLTRTSHLKESDASKIDQAIANYSLEDTSFTVFNNTEDTCSISRGSHLDPSVLLTSAAAFALFKKLF